MKRLILHSLMILWIIICPIISLWGSSISQSDFHANRILHHYSEKNTFIKSESHSSWLGFDQLSLLDNTESDQDIFSFGNKFVLIPQYLLLFLYAGLLFQFCLFFKRRLPFCYFLAKASRRTYLAKKTFLI